MLLLFGTRAYETLIVLVMMICPHCHLEAQQRVMKHTNRFTFFFLPLFTISAQYFVECSNCEATTELTKDQANHAVAWAAAHGGRESAPV